ncbi:MAG: hypothetical protein IT304_05575 [Dehalococcoidia bacterium]|nr:hypothetical protein [Dehalococcoidia bacterium]
MIATRITTREEAEDLRVLLSERSMKIAPAGQPFKLASGRESNLYFDSKHVTLSPEGILPVGRLFLDQAERWGTTAVGGLAAGSIPISTAVMACAAMLGKTNVRSFYVRAEGKKEHGTKELIFQSFDRDNPAGPVHAGAKVLLVDDVLTTGKSISTAAEAVLEREATIAAIVILVDRCEGGAATLRERFGVPVVALYKANERGELTFHDDEVF